jgi:hypothetical protein
MQFDQIGLRKKSYRSFASENSRCKSARFRPTFEDSALKRSFAAMRYMTKMGSERLL